MLIAIITQPLMTNYGGLLQNWALQQVLKREFPQSEVVTFDQTEWTMPLHIKCGITIKRMLGLSKHPGQSPFDNFRLRNISATYKAETLRDLRKLDKELHPDVYIVGSDQVWRPEMVNHIDANFLSFTRCPNKIAYAASFGVDSWEFSEDETRVCRQLVAAFKAVSVREDSGIALCRNFLGISSTQVLDPTLLLCSKDYDSLISDEQKVSLDEYVFTYILNTDSHKQRIVSLMLNGRKEIAAAHDCRGKYICPRLSVESWITSIRNSRLVICDSFHGVAFSLIYKKDFIVLPNVGRGNTRLHSILKLTGLQDRLITTEDDISKIKKISWNEVDKIIKDNHAVSLTFLHSAIDQCRRF